MKTFNLFYIQARNAREMHFPSFVIWKCFVTWSELKLIENTSHTLNVVKKSSHISEFELESFQI